MRSVVWVVVVGCGYAPDRTPATDPDPDAVAPTDQAPVDGTPPAPCSVPDPNSLVACFSFDADFTAGMLVDDSGNGFHATTSGLVPTARPNGATSSPAATVSGTNSTHVPDDAALDLTTPYTLSAWLAPTAITTNNQGVIEHEAQYALTLTPTTGEVRCWLNTTAGLVRPLGPIAAVDTWQLGACTWDGANLCAIVIPMVGVGARVCLPTTGTVGNGNDGLWIGTMAAGGIATERITGAIDDVRIYRRMLSDAELCTLAGRAAGCL